MLGDWSYAGFPPSEFWEQSPRDYHAIMAGFIQRKRDDYDAQTRQGHLTAVLVQAAKIPPVSDLLLASGKSGPVGQVPAGEGLAAWASVLGGMG